MEKGSLGIKYTDRTIALDKHMQVIAKEHMEARIIKVKRRAQYSTRTRTHTNTQTHKHTCLCVCVFVCCV